MKKIILLVLLSILVTACGSLSSQMAATEDTAESDLEPAVELTEESEALPEPTSLDESEEDATQPGKQTAEASSDPLFPASNVVDASIIRSTDHIVGAVEPVVSIIEYGDFQ